jgi:hypothetical protein
LAKAEMRVIGIPAGRIARRRRRWPPRRERNADPGCSPHNPGGELSGDRFFIFFTQ